MDNIAILVGCQEYDIKPLMLLPGVNEDIQEMKNVLIDNCSCAEEDVYVCAFMDDCSYKPEHATSVTCMIDDIISRSQNKIYDYLFFYYSGHGYSSKREVFLALQKTDYLYGLNAISENILVRKLIKSKLAKRFVCFFDMCLSENNEKGYIDTLRTADYKELVCFHSCSLGDSSFLVPSLFFDKYGKGSLYTKCLVKALGKNSKCKTVLDISRYIENEIQSLCKDIGLIQIPQTFSHDIDCEDWIITNNNASDINSDKSLSVGEEMSFGTYPQGTRGKKMPIRWDIIDTSDEDILMISHFVLDAKPINTTCDICDWSQSELYNWLHFEFLENVFSRKERRCISDIFLLSKDEALTYFKDNKARKAIATNYAIAEGVKTDSRFSDSTGEYCQWWLRDKVETDIKTNCKFLRVFSDGVIYPKGRKVNRKDIGLRPVLRVDKRLL